LSAHLRIKVTKSIPVSQEAFRFKSNRLPLGQNLGLYNAMDISEAHVAPAWLHFLFRHEKSKKASQFPRRLFVSNPIACR
jgi:hypothetical protein